MTAADALKTSQQPKTYTPKEVRDDFFEWFFDVYPMSRYLVTLDRLPKTADIQRKYLDERGGKISAGHVRDITRFYTIYRKFNVYL